MRDVNHRSLLFLLRLWWRWRKFPRWRLGHMLLVATTAPGGKFGDDDNADRLWNAENDDILRGVDEQIRRHRL